MACDLYPDGNALEDYCLGEAQNYYNEYRSKVTLHHLQERLAAHVHMYTLYFGILTFGIFL